ncbi:MAG: hypothetical protein K2P58_02585 [Hyphomonadaceae bacterium]|nr:hypothetical protein [Hyphomonadaceae bacterium]
MRIEEEACAFGLEARERSYRMEVMGDDPARAYQLEMETRRGRVAMGGTDLSERALRYRQAQSIGDGRNVAVFEYEDSNGTRHYIERASEGTGRHSELLGVRELQRLGIRPEQVTRIYSDRQPCRGCDQLIAPYSRARVTWGADYAQRNKTDRHDALGLAQMMRTGWFKSVHVKSDVLR